MRSLRNKALSLFAALALGGWVLGTPVSADAEPKGLTVIELFTSQGCSSCPPADALLGELTAEPGILGLSFHVDYWDYIGWADPYAKKAYSKRQRGYAQAFKKSFVYTPQMVVHGMIETTGSDAGSIRQAIKQTAQRLDTPIRINRTKAGGLTVTIGQSSHPVDASVWLAFFDPEHTTKVKRGENRGRVIKNFNVVRELRHIGDWHGKAVKFTVPPLALKGHDKQGCAVFLQNPAKGPILGAAAIQLSDNSLPQR
jgi:hypothetical protein